MKVVKERMETKRRVKIRVLNIRMVVEMSKNKKENYSVK